MQKPKLYWSDYNKMHKIFNASKLKHLEQVVLHKTNVLPKLYFDNKTFLTSPFHVCGCFQDLHSAMIDLHVFVGFSPLKCKETND